MVAAAAAMVAMCSTSYSTVPRFQVPPLGGVSLGSGDGSGNGSDGGDMLYFLQHGSTVPGSTLAGGAVVAVVTAAVMAVTIDGLSLSLSSLVSQKYILRG